MKNQKPLLVRTLSGEAVERAPVWLMRQAGRYLSEYQELKAKYSFLELCTTPDLAVEVTLQPMRIFNPDAAILFSDILVTAKCLGIRVDFKPGPVIHNPLQADEISNLKLIPPGECLGFVFETLRRLRKELDSAEENAPKALLGFAGAPWTMACYLVDQGPYKHFHGTQVMAYESPQAMHKLLESLAHLTADYLIEQIKSGADAVQLFDSWAGNLSLEDYRRFALPYTKLICERVQAAGAPLILYVNGSSHLFEAMLESGATGLSVDWRTPLGSAQTRAGEQRTIQGNLDPTHLFGSVEEVKRRTREMLATLTRRQGYIANLGHGVLQRTPRENVAAFVNTIKEGWC